MWLQCQKSFNERKQKATKTAFYESVMQEFRREEEKFLWGLVAFWFIIIHLTNIQNIFSFQLCECEELTFTSSYIALIWVCVVALRPASFGPCQILSVAFHNTECVELVVEKSLCFTVQLDESVHDKRNRKGKWKPLVTCRVLRFHHRLLAGDINTDYRHPLVRRGISSHAVGHQL